MIKIIANTNRKIENHHWDRFFDGKLKPIDHKIYHFYKWMCHFIPYKWFLVGDEDDNICEAKEDELWVDELWTADDVIWTVNNVEVNDGTIWTVDTDAIWTVDEELWQAVDAIWTIEA